MDEVGSISRLILRAKGGDEAALSELHRRYWPRMVSLSRRRLSTVPPLPLADEEDIAQNAFIGFYRTIRSQQMLDLSNRHQLLALLTHIVACKALNEMKHEMAQKRGGGLGRANVEFSDLVTRRQESPEHLAILNDCYQHYLESLPETTREFAELHLAGLTNREIAEQSNCSERTVERKLALLRIRWRQLAADSVSQDVDSLLAAPTD